MWTAARSGARRASKSAPRGARAHAGTAGVRRRYHGVGAIANRTGAEQPWLDDRGANHQGSRSQPRWRGERPGRTRRGDTRARSGL